MLTVEGASSAWTSQNLVELAKRSNAARKGNASTSLVAIDQWYGHSNIHITTVYHSSTNSKQPKAVMM